MAFWKKEMTAEQSRACSNLIERQTLPADCSRKAQETAFDSSAREGKDLRRGGMVKSPYKKQSDPCVTPHTKINSKWIEELM